MVAIHPDLEDVAQGEREGRHLTPARWVPNAVGENDVVTVNIFGKVKNTFIGDNLACGVSSQKGAGLVIDGGAHVDPVQTKSMQVFQGVTRSVGDSTIQRVRVHSKVQRKLPLGKLPMKC